MSVQSEIDRIITAVGNAYSKVSEKGGTVPASQTVSNLATAIGSLPAGGGAPSLQSKSVTYTANGTDTITPDEGYDGLSSVNVTVNTNVEPSVSNLNICSTVGGAQVTFIYVGENGVQTFSLGDYTIVLSPIIGSLVVVTAITNGHNLETDNVYGLEFIHSLEEASLTKALVYRVIDSYSNINFSIPCLIAGTLITLADGSTKPVEDIAYDDDILVWDFFNGCFASAKPRWIKIKQTADVYNKLTFDNGATLGLVGKGGTQGYHRIFNKQACCFTHTGVPETPNGTITFAEDESEPVLVSQELVHNTVDYYNIITDKHFNLFANGILTSCKCSNIYRIEDMKYVGERLMNDKDIETYFAWLESLKLPNSKGGAIL